MIRTLLIDDETSARADLRAKLSLYPNIEIAGEAATVNSARELLASAVYELVFLDVQLIGGDAFDLVPYVRDGAGIIFATGYEHYAVRAFEINALDYLLKPIEPSRLAASLQRLSLSPEAQPRLEPDSFQPGVRLAMNDVIYLRTGGRAQFTPLSTVSLIAARDNYSEVYLADGTRCFLRKTLKSWEDVLPESHFMRVHRTQIVNLARLQRYERDRDEHTLLFIEGSEEPVSVSRYRWPDFQARLASFRRLP